MAPAIPTESAHSIPASHGPPALTYTLASATLDIQGRGSVRYDRRDMCVAPTSGFTGPSPGCSSGGRGEWSTNHRPAHMFCGRFPIGAPPFFHRLVFYRAMIFFVAAISFCDKLFETKSFYPN